MSRSDSERPSPRRPASSRDPATADDDSYDLAEFDEPAATRPAPAAFPTEDAGTAAEPETAPPTAPDGARRPKRPAAPDPNEAARDAALVSEVWTRQAESWPTLALLAIAGLTVAFFTYGAFAAGQFGLGVLIFLVGGLACLVLSYPLAITLERPLRLTPEQAVNDYFHALSHHLPHYRRMWLLLSDLGKTTGSFGSLAEFRDYWKTRLAEWRRVAGISRTTPLTFRVSDFKSERSAGKTSVEATVTVQVFPRGRDSEPPIAEYRYDLGLVKGPDRMWYLNEGAIPAGGSGRSR